MTYFLLGLLSVVGIEVFLVLRLPEKIAAMAIVSRDSMRVLASSSLSDAEKEVAARRGSLALLKATTAFSARFLLVCAAAYCAYLLMAVLLPGQGDEMLRVIASVSGLVAMTLMAAFYVWMRNVLRKKL